MNKQFSGKLGFPNKETSSENSKSFSDDVFVFTRFLEAVVNAQTNITTDARQGFAALAVRIVELVEHVVDGKVDIERVFAQGFPVGEYIVHAVAFAFDFALVANQYRTGGFLEVATTPADFQIRILEAVGEGGRPSAAGLYGKFGVCA